MQQMRVRVQGSACAALAAAARATVIHAVRLPAAIHRLSRSRGCQHGATACGAARRKSFLPWRQVSTYARQREPAQRVPLRRDKICVVVQRSAMKSEPSRVEAAALITMRY